MIAPIKLEDFRHLETARADPGYRAWARSIAAKFWSRLRRAQKHRRTRQALQALDDQMLKDIGIGRSEIDWVAGHDAAREVMRMRALASCQQPGRQPASTGGRPRTGWEASRRSPANRPPRAPSALQEEVRIRVYWWSDE